MALASQKNSSLHGERVLIMALKKPEDMRVHPTTGEIGWMPTATGNYDISLALLVKNFETSLAFLDRYDFTIVVGPPGAAAGPASASFTAEPGLGSAPLSVAFDASASRGTDGAMILQYVILPGTGPALRSTLPVTSYHYQQPGAFLVELEIWDAMGAIARAKSPAAVTDGDKRPPQTRINATALDANAPSELSLHADVKDSDGMVESLLWTPPDGRTSTAADVALHLDTAGYHVTTLEVIDNDGLKGVDAWTVTVRQNKVLRPRIVSTPTPVVRVGESYHYDLDGTVVAQGSRPLIWSLGKMIEGQTTNAPDGMSIDPRTGALLWTPADHQEGNHWVTIMVINDAGMDVQEFEVTVDGAAAAAVDGAKVTGACEGSSDSGGTAASGVLLLMTAALAAMFRRAFSSPPYDAVAENPLP